MLNFNGQIGFYMVTFILNLSEGFRFFTAYEKKFLAALNLAVVFGTFGWYQFQVVFC